MTFEDAIKWGRPVRFVLWADEGFLFLDLEGRIQQSVGVFGWDEVRGFSQEEIDELWEPCLWEGEDVGPWELKGEKK